ncbi:hypothetical protein ANCCAN_16300, partial [Ancylostoma caninum]
RPSLSYEAVTCINCRSTCISSGNSCFLANRRGVLIDKEDYSEETDDSEEIIEEDSDCELPKNSRRVTLGDFLTTVERNPPTEKRRTDSRIPEDTCTKKQLLTMPASLVDISEATNAPHIFEIFEITTPKMSEDDLEQEA